MMPRRLHPRKFTFPSVSICRQLYFLPEKLANPSRHLAAAPTARNKVSLESAPARRHSRRPFRLREIPAPQCVARSLSFPTPLFLLSILRKTVRPFSLHETQMPPIIPDLAHHCPLSNRTSTHRRKWAARYSPDGYFRLI